MKVMRLDLRSNIAVVEVVLGDPFEVVIEERNEIVRGKRLEIVIGQGM